MHPTNIADTARPGMPHLMRIQEVLLISKIWSQSHAKHSVFHCESKAIGSKYGVFFFLVEITVQIGRSNIDFQMSRIIVLIQPHSYILPSLVLFEQSLDVQYD